MCKIRRFTKRCKACKERTKHTARDFDHKRNAEGDVEFTNTITCEECGETVTRTAYYLSGMAV